MENHMQKLTEEVNNCKRCPLHQQCFKPVPGLGKLQTTLMVVKHYPDREDELYDEPLTGRKLDLLKFILSEAKINDHYITNLVKCSVDNSDEPNYKAIARCKYWLWQEIQLVKPKVIVTLGLDTSKLLTKEKIKKLADVVGKSYIKKYDNLFTIVIPCYSLDRILNSNKKDLEKTIEIFKKVKEMM